MAENEHANTQVWLPRECEVEIEPDTEAELTTSDRFFGAHARISTVSKEFFKCVSVSIQGPPKTFPEPIGLELRILKTCQKARQARPFHAAPRARSGPYRFGATLRSGATVFVRHVWQELTVKLSYVYF